MPLLLTLLSGCWVNDLFIRNIDTLIEIKIADNLGLYYGQKKQLEKDTSSFLNNSKSMAKEAKLRLSSYEKLLDHKNHDQKHFQELIYQEVLYWQGIHREIMERLITKHMDYLANLSPAQQNEFFREAKAKNKDLKEKLQELKRMDEPQEKLKELSKSFAYVFDELNKAQLKVIKESEAFLISRAEDYIKRRLRFQKGLKSLYDKEDKPENKNKAFKQMARASLEKRYSEAVTREYSVLISKLIKMSEEKERKKAMANLKKFEQWLEVFIKTNY